MNKTREKILLLLEGGVDFIFAYTSRRKWRVIKRVSKKWKQINGRELQKGISYLYRLGFVEKEESSNGSIKVMLTKKGKLMALNQKLKGIKNKNTKWDKKWRMVAFDIPEKYKKGRDALRNKLKKIGFCELQKSVLVTPYDCIEEIGLLIDFFKLKKYVRFAVLESIDNEKELKSHFTLSLSL